MDPDLYLQDLLGLEDRFFEAEIADECVAIDFVRLIEPGVKFLGSWDQGARDEPGMLEEVPADEIVLVPDTAAAHAVGRKQQAGVLDAAGRQHDDRCPDREAVARESGGVDALDASAVRIRLDLDGVGVEKDVDPWRRLQHGPVAFAERPPGLGDDLCQDVGEPARLPEERARAVGADDILRITPLGLQAHDRPRRRVVRVEVFARDRPAAPCHPRSLGEVARLEWSAVATPVIRAATEVTQAGGFQREVRETCA